MENLKTLFTDKFRDKELSIVFHKWNLRKILGATMVMKTDHCRKHKIKLGISKLDIMFSAVIIFHDHGCTEDFT